MDTTAFVRFKTMGVMPLESKQCKEELLPRNTYLVYSSCCDIGLYSSLGGLQLQDKHICYERLAPEFSGSA